MDYKKHQSSYFKLPAAYVVVIAYLLPGFLGMINVNLSYFATLVLIVVAVLERKSEMVRFYCYQFSFLAMFFNIILSVLNMIGMFIPIVQLVNVMLSFIVASIVIFAYFYSLFRALQYKGWIIPWVGPFILKTILRINR